MYSMRVALVAALTLLSALLTVSMLFPGVTGATPVSAARSGHTIRTAEAVGTPNSEGATVSVSPSLAHPSTSFRITILTRPAYCTITIGLTSYGNGSIYAGAQQGYQTIVADICPNEAFLRWDSSVGTVNNTSANPATLDVEANGTLTAVFAYGYNVTFTETGLVLGTIWNVWINGNPFFSTSAAPTTVVAQESNNTYRYYVAPQAGYYTRPSSEVTVAGSDVQVSIVFTSLAYNVMFEARGLPDETRWSVTLNGTTSYSLSPWITFAEFNSTYQFTVGTVAGFTANLTDGQVVVSGHTVTVNVTFAAQGGSSSSSLPTWELASLAGGVGAAAVAGGLGYLFLVGRKRPPQGGPP